MKQKHLPRQNEEEESKTKKQDAEVSGPSGLGIDHLQGIFLIYIIANLLALIVFFFEIIIPKSVLFIK